MLPDPYAELGVSATATPEEIRRAYLRAARANHPDRFAEAGSEDRRQAELRMRRINAAWQHLSSIDTRGEVTAPRPGAETSFVVGDDGVDVDDDIAMDELDDSGAPLPAGARLATALGPILMVCAAGLVFFGLIFVIPAVIAVGFATGAVALASFLAAPLLAMGDARRHG